MSRSSRKAVVAVAALLVVLAGPLPVAAQHVTTGSIAGSVVGPDGAPVAGATVKLISKQGVASATTDRDGRFLLPHLTPARYDVRVEHRDFRPAELQAVDVRLGQQGEVAVTLSPGAFSNTVEVTAAAAVLDLRSAGVSLTVDDELIARIPVGRQLADTFYLAPGASASSGAGASNPSISGASGLENQYVVDGVNLTNSRYGAFGVYSSEYGPLGNGVTTEFIEELQVRSAGAEAELEQSSGGLVTTITRSGTNDVAGSAFAYLTPAALEGDRRTLELADGTVNTVGESSSEVGFTIGGPLVRDRVFYFAAASRLASTTTFVAPEGFPLEALGEVDRDRSGVAYAGKLTVLAGGGQRLELSAFGDPTTGDTGPQSAAAMRYENTSAFSALDVGSHN